MKASKKLSNKSAYHFLHRNFLSILEFKIEIEYPKS